MTVESAREVGGLGAIGSLIAMAALVALFYYLLPGPDNINDMSDRIAYALRANALAVLPLFVMIGAIGNARVVSKAMNPLANAETRTLEIDCRVAGNTLEQNFIFFVATCALSTVLAEQHLGLIGACTIVFVIARVCFWIGYRINPLYRAPGMAATSYLNLGLLLTAVYSALVV